MADISTEAATIEGYRTRMLSAQAYATIAQAEQTKRLADAYEALLQFNKENMEQSRKQSAELSAKVGSLLDALAGIE